MAFFRCFAAIEEFPHILKRMTDLFRVFAGSLRLSGKIFFYCLYLLILTEIGLRIGGFFFIQAQEWKNTNAAAARGQIRILALGESTTADAFAKNFLSWPRLLERELNAQGLSVQVTNEGRVGTDSSLILSRLATFLTQSRPQVVIAMMGINDRGGIGVNRTNLLIAPDSGFWRSLRIVKLFRLVWYWPEVFPQLPSLENEKTPETKSDFRTFPQIVKAAFAGNTALADELIEKELDGRSKEERARLYSYIAAAATPPQDNAPDALGISLRYRRLELQNVLQNESAMIYAIIANNTKDVEGCQWLAREFLRQGKQPNDVTLRFLITCAQPELTEAIQLRKLYAPAITVKGAEEPNQTAVNYRLLYDILSARGICLVAMQYPLRPVSALREYFSPEQIREEAKFPLLSFVSNEKNFALEMTHRTYEELFIDRFARDFGHTTALGHGLIAKNVAQTVADLIRRGACKSP